MNLVKRSFKKIEVVTNVITFRLKVETSITTYPKMDNNSKTTPN